ncbi:MAG TPA: replicative DNA helicase [Pirellulales bacterium]|nr:replicative DNA helicase [Pirellulales bacterium]
MPPPLLDILPHSPDAERTLLGAILLDPERLLDVAAIVRPADFYDPVYRSIYDAMCRLKEAHKPIDFVTISEALAQDKNIQAIGGSAFLAELASSVPTSSHAPRYAEIVGEKSLHRRLIEVGGRIAALGKDVDMPALDALERAEQTLLQLARHTTDRKPQHIAEIGEQSYERYAQLHAAEDKEALFGLRTGFRDLDRMLTGLQPGHLMIVAARPGMGKTSFALDLARQVASKQRKNVAVFSLEMTKQELMDRIIAGFLGVEAWKLKKGELTQDDFTKLGTLFDGLKQHPLFIDDDPDTTISNLRSKARRQQMEHGLDLLIIDYLQLIEVTDRVASSENRTQQVSYISRSLKNLARELQCPIIALSQLSRNVEQRNPPIPILSDLRESGSIEQDADTVLMLYRDDAYNEDSAQPGMADLNVRKNRNGPTGRVGLHFDHARMSFTDALPGPQT